MAAPSVPSDLILLGIRLGGERLKTGRPNGRPVRGGLLLACLVLMAGCAGSGAGPGDGAPLGGSIAPPVVVTKETGSIDGLVLDVELSPLAGVVVIVAPTNATLLSDINGRFVLNDLPPGTYDVSAAHPAYEPSAAKVEVEAERATPHRITLTPLPTDTPHPSVWHQKGFASCFIGTRLPTTGNGNIGCGSYYNSGQNKHQIRWPAIPLEGWNASAFEQVWRSGQVAGRGMQGQLYIPACGNLLFMEGESPLSSIAKEDAVLTWKEKAATSCKTDCPDGTCILQTWVGTVPSLLGAGAPADFGIMLDQPFEQYHTAFYRMAVPPGYKARPDA